MSQVIAHAPAKINLALEVKTLSPGDEKHHLNSVFCTVALADTLVFNFIGGNEPFNAQVTIENANSGPSYVKSKDNTLIKAVEFFKKEYGFGFLPSGTLHVQLIKSIPTQAGLGGGSSDAAAMLRMLCWLSQVEPTSDKSLAVARAVGADVPFFLYAPKAGFCAHMTGYGDELTQVLPKPKLNLALVKPHRGVSTKKAYAAFDAEMQGAKSSTAVEAEQQESIPMVAVDELVSALSAEADAATIAALCANNLEQAAVNLLPGLQDIKQELQDLQGVLSVVLSGSGSTFFAICRDADAARACMEHAAQKGLWAVATQT